MKFNQQKKMGLNNRKLTNHPHSSVGMTNKQTNNNDLLEKDGGTKNCIYKD